MQTDKNFNTHFMTKEKLGDAGSFSSSKVLTLKFSYHTLRNYLQLRPIKLGVFHQNESYLSGLHPPSSYEGMREQGRLLSF